MNILLMASAKINKNIIKKIKNQNFNYIIAADGGYNNLLKIGLKPNIIIGDLDSIKKPPLNTEYQIFNTNKDFSDFYLALNFVKKRFKKVTNLTIVGIVDEERIDHTIANFLSIIKFKFNTIIYAKQNIYIIHAPKKIKLKLNKGQLISIIEIKKGLIKSKNLKFKIKNNKLLNPSHGISNIALKNNIEINIIKGSYIIIF